MVFLVFFKANMPDASLAEPISRGDGFRRFVPLLSATTPEGL
jgi:hypothetical protein